MMNARRPLWAFGALVVVVAVPALAAPYTLTNGPGDGTVTVGVDGFGAFGSSVGADSTNAIYDPVGAGGPAGTTYQSGVAIRFSTTGGGRTFLTSGNIGGSGGLANPAVAGSPTLGVSAFVFGPLSIRLTQTLTPLMTGSVQTGSLLTQTYVMTNTGTEALSLEMIRYLDGDLYFDGSLIDGGGRLFVGSLEILFETDSATGSATSTTFVGITGEGGTIPAAGRYEIDSYSGLRSRIVSGSGLNDSVTNDGIDADQFIDAGFGYDVTMALRNIFTLPAGGSDTYVTRTFFGSGTPEAVPGVIPTPSAVAAGLMLLGGLAIRRAIRR
jgi:hypothetical protein